MLIAEPLGVVGAPEETLQVLQAALADTDLTDAVLTLVTDSQGQRQDARYGVLIQLRGDTLITVEAFGGRYGPSGVAGLQALARWAQSKGVITVRETVVNTYDFNRVLREPDEGEIRQLVASANPSDLNIYLG